MAEMVTMSNRREQRKQRVIAATACHFARNVQVPGPYGRPLLRSFPLCFLRFPASHHTCHPPGELLECRRAVSADTLWLGE